MIADGVQTDEMRDRTTREMAAKLVHRDHFGAALATLFYGKHDDADLAILDNVLAPDVTAIDEMFHRPLGKPVGIAQPFLGYPMQPLVPRKLRKVIDEFYATFSHPPTKFFFANS